MNEFAEQFMFRLGLASAFLSGAAVIAWGMLLVFRCKSPFVHRTVWCLVLAQALLVFQFPIAIPWKSEGKAASALGEAVVTLESSVTLEAVTANQAISEKSQEAEISQRSFSRHWPSILLAVWSVGILTILGQWFMRYVWFIRNLPCKRCENESWSQEWDEVQAERDVANRIPLYISDCGGPMLCRWPNGQRVIVPKSLWSRLPPEQRKAILCHELAHFERHDLLKTLIANLVAAVHWFNPLAWFAVRRFEDSVEWTCDRIVQSSKPEANLHYAKALLALGSNISQPTAWASAVDGGGLAARIRRVVSADHASDSRAKVLTTIGILLGLSAVHIVRVDLVAQEANEQAKSAISNDYFIAPIVTDLQKWTLSRGSMRDSDRVSVYASVNGRAFFDRQRPTLDMARFDFDSFVRDLASVQKTAETGGAEIRIAIEFESIENESIDEKVAKVEAAFRLKMKEAGIENTKFIKTYINDNRDWKKLAVETESKHKEPKLGNERVSIFPVKTALSRILMPGSPSLNGGDCLINVTTVLPLNANSPFTSEDKEVIRSTVSELQLPKGSAALLMVHFEDPRSGKEIQDQFPQIKKDSEFQRSAVDFLKSLGFARVGTNVDISSVAFTDVHD